MFVTIFIVYSCVRRIKYTLHYYVIETFVYLIFVYEKIYVARNVS